MVKQTLLTLAALSLVAGSASAGEIELSDPEGDDNGPGTYTYPTDRAYNRGDFDIREVTIEWDDDDVTFEVEVSARINDVWDSPAWNGNGFSVQFAQIYIDTDQGASGHTAGVPGVNVNFEAPWNYVVLISPQPASRVHAEIAEKASEMQGAIVVPQRTTARGRSITGRAPRSDFGGTDPATWRIQVIMQSNEGYPTATDLLSRRVNEFEGPHRFGGGNDFDCDPHVMDILAGSAQGEASEVELQHQALGSYVCNDDGTGTRATLPYVVRE